jgi:hypothetical protein
MPESILAQLGVAGVVVIILLAGMRWMAGQYSVMQAALTAQQKACEEREAKLTQRIQAVEDRQNVEQSRLLASAVNGLAEASEALRINAGVIERFADHESGRHHARKE